MSNPTIEALLVLQERDTKVGALTSELEKLPDQIAAVEAELAAKTARFEELKNKARLTEMERKKIDLEVKSKEAAIARYKAQQQQTRKNEEYSALTHEIEHTEKEISDLEDKELELMEAYDRAQALVAEGQKELAKAQEKAKQNKAALEKRSAAVTTELVTAKEQQAAAESAVEEDVLARYRRILKSKKDAAIVPIQGGACSRCHMKLTSQTVLSARSAETLTSCDNCGRLIYWTGE
ncbi:MAG TPA: C4-type zinc ribbon domain-containing protein [Candidatus Methylacidiphilales bacterium]|nr:C4-type zinc ribbon domain-containing protein [Candidatus Methylacidiphilales bacterium]